MDLNITRKERRAYIIARMIEAVKKLGGREDFDFSATDPRINNKQVDELFEILNQRISDFINGDCRAEQVQAAWIDYARAHQLKQPEPQSLFGKENSDERKQAKRSAGRRKTTAKRSGTEIK